MEIAKIMTHRVVSVEMDNSQRTVKSIFDNSQFHHLLVVEGVFGWHYIRPRFAHGG